MRCVAAAALICCVSAWNAFEASAIKGFANEHVKSGMQVLDVGGRVVQGGPRSSFEKRGCNYTAMDIQADKSVDIVHIPGKPFPFSDGTFDIVITTSTFEHDPMFWMTLREMARVTKVSGLIYATAPHGGHYHPFPGDNWRFMHDAGAALAFWCGRTIDGESYPLALHESYSEQCPPCVLSHTGTHDSIPQLTRFYPTVTRACMWAEHLTHLPSGMYAQLGPHRAKECLNSSCDGSECESRRLNSQRRA